MIRKKQTEPQPKSPTMIDVIIDLQNRISDLATRHKQDREFLWSRIRELEANVAVIKKQNGEGGKGGMG